MAAEGEAEVSLQTATSTELEVLPEKATENVTGPSGSETASQEPEPSEVETARGPASKTTGAVNKAMELGLIQDIVLNRPDSFMLQDLIIARRASVQGL